MKLAIVAAALLLPASAPAKPPPKPATEPAQSLPAPAERPADPVPHRAMPNLLSVGAPTCRSIARQVADENKRADNRRGEARTLDREPSAHLLLAVDRQVGGCREVTFLRRNAAPGSVMPDLPSRRSVRP